MPTLPSRNVRRHKNALVTIRASRTSKRLSDPELLNTPTLSESSYTESEADGYSPSISPSIAASSIRSAADSPHMSFGNDLQHPDINPFLLPPGQYPLPPPPPPPPPHHPAGDIYSSIDAYILGPNPAALYDEKVVRAQLALLQPPTTMPRKK
jgi:hypothetical protein